MKVMTILAEAVNFRTLGIITRAYNNPRRIYSRKTLEFPYKPPTL
jgi:hypothetical protein